MATRTPQSLTDAMLQEPWRFAKYLNINGIIASNNPYKEFLTQFKEAFDSTKGLSLWQYVENKYNLLNRLYKYDKIQEQLPNEFKGALKRKDTREFFEEQLEEVAETQEEREKKVKRPIKTKLHRRDGKIIRGYSRTTSHKYTDRQRRFILSRKDFKIKLLADEFNRAFSTSLTSIALRDKRARLLGRKE